MVHIDMVASLRPSSRLSRGDHRPIGPRAARPRLFGQFLVERGVLSPAQLGDALTLMRALNSSIGELAVAHGLVTRAQADQIHAMQRHLDRRWGEIAVALGIPGIETETIERLAWEQDVANLRLSDAVVELGFASATEIDALHREFEDADHSADGIALDERGGELLAGMPRIVARTLGSPVRVGGARTFAGTTLAHHVEIEITGPSPVRLAFAAERTLARAIAVALPDASARAGARLDQAVGSMLELLAEHARDRLDSRAAGHVVGTVQVDVRSQQGVAIPLALADGQGLIVLA